MSPLQWLALGVFLTEPAAAQGPPVDIGGDPLPKGASARLGSLRYRHWPHTEWVGISRDSKVLAFGGQQSGFWFVDRASGKWLAKVAPLGLALNPVWSSQAHVLAAACRFSIWPPPPGAPADKSAVLFWDTRTGKELRRVEVPPFFDSGLALSADGKTVALGGQDGVVRLIDVATGKVRKEIRAVGAPSFSPDGQWLAVAGERDIVLWDLAQDKERARLAHPRAFASLSYGKLMFSPDSQVLVGAGSFGFVSCWKVGMKATGEYLGDFPSPGSYQILSLSFSADSKHLAVGRWYRRDKQTIYDVATRTEVRNLDSGIGVLSYSADGKFLVGAEGTGVIRVWDQASLKEVAGPLGHRGRVTLLRFLDNDRVVTVCPGDKTYRLWDARTGRGKARFPLGADPAHGAVLSADGTLLAVNEWDGGPGTNPKIIRVIEVATGKVRATLEAGFNHVPLAFAAKNSVLYAGTEGSKLIVWDLAQGKEQRRWNLGKVFPHKAGHLPAALTPDENALAVTMATYSSPQPGAVAVRHHTVLLDLQTGKEVWSQDTERDGGALLFSKAGDVLLEDVAGVVLVRERATGKVLRELASRKPPETFPWPYSSTLAMFPDGKTVLTTNGRERVHLWDIASGKELHAQPTHDGQVIALAVSPDGRRFATAGDDMTVLIWRRP